jgi:hypothetical protein
MRNVEQYVHAPDPNSQLACGVRKKIRELRNNVKEEGRR